MFPKSSVRLSVEPLHLELHDPFTLSHGTSTQRRNLLVRVQWTALEGQGEAAVVPYYGETDQDLVRQLEHPGLLGHLTPGAPLNPERVLLSLRRPLSPPAMAALDMALHDLWARRRGSPLHRLWGLDPAGCPATSFTVAMALDDDSAYRERVRAARSYRLLKLKLGSGEPDRDLELVRMAGEEASGCRLCVDANGGWSAAQAAQIIGRLAPLDLLYIEQPVPGDDLEAWRELRKDLPAGAPPLMADESFQGEEDLSTLTGLADGVNIKLAKMGGLAPARRAMEKARSLGFKVLLGCMVESSLGVTAAAQLAPLCDFADLDGHLLLADDPFIGLEVDPRGEVALPQYPGLGVERR